MVGIAVSCFQPDTSRSTKLQQVSGITSLAFTTFTARAGFVVTAVLRCFSGGTE